MKWRSIIKTQIYSCLGLLFTFSLLLVSAANSQLGLRLLLACIQAPLYVYGIEINSSSATGTLAHFTLPNVKIRTSTTDVNIDNLAISWHPLALLEGKIAIQSLNIYQIEGSWNPAQYSLAQHTKAGDHTPTFDLDIKQFSLENVQLNIGQGNISGKLAFDSNLPQLNWDMQLNGHNLDSSLFNIHLAGPMNFTIQANQAKQHIDASLPEYHFIWNSKGDSQSVGTYRITDILVNTPLGDWSLSQPSTLTILHNNINLDTLCLKHASAKVCLQANWQPKKILAKADITVPNIGIFQSMLPGSYDISGQLNGSMTVAGNIDSPNLQGQFTISDAAASIPNLGIKVYPINANLLAKNNTLLILATAQSGQGVMSIKGNLLPVLENPSITLFITATHFLLADLPEANIIASSNMQYRLKDHTQNLNGEIEINSANIQIEPLQRKIPSESDIVYIDSTGNIINPSPALPISMQLSLRIDKNVSLKGLGIQTYLAGQLKIHSLSSTSITATGKLQLIKGEYETYGKHFVIQKGELIFAQSVLENPNLNIHALYDLPPTNSGNIVAPSLQVGVDILGTLQSPQIELFSNPAMSQEDILSYIVLGQPFSAIQETDKSALSQAAMAIAASSGSNSILTSIQKKLGLNQIALGSLNSASPLTSSNAQDPNVAQDNTAVFIGKTISPRLYVRYGIGLFNNQQELDSILQLSKYWSLKTNAGTQATGADLVFTIDR